jgi:hypothetical protein
MGYKKMKCLNAILIIYGSITKLEKFHDGCFQLLRRRKGKIKRKTISGNL